MSELLVLNVRKEFLSLGGFEGSVDFGSPRPYTIDPTTLVVLGSLGLPEATCHF